MALKIIDARQSGFPHDGTFGRAHLIFDRDIDANPLRLSLFVLNRQEYLARSSPPKANWTPARSQFFSAAQVARGSGKTVFVLGPEVTTFIPPESSLEVASEDNAIRERAVWSAISVDFTWPGPPPEPPPKPEKVPDTILVSLIGQQPTASQGQAEKTPEPVQTPVQTPTATTTTTTDPSKPPKPPGPPPNWGLRAIILAAVGLAAGAIYGVYWGSQNREVLCDRYGWFCDAEVVAYRAAQSCAAPKTCGATACLAGYRNTYPNGRFKAQVDELAVGKGRPCEETPPRPDPEKLAYDRVVACATPKTCGASVCVTEYRQMFPTGAHKTDVDQIVAQKGGECVDAVEKEVYDQAVGCARPKSCGALECVAEYRRRYPSGRYKVQIDQLALAQNARACSDPVEEDVFERAMSCARPKSCGADECLGEYRRRFPNGRHKAEIDQIAQSPKGQACPDLDKEAYDRADRCAAPLRCGADHCLIEYRRDFGNGRYRSLIDQIASVKGPACSSPTPTSSPTSDLPPFVPIQPGDDPGIRNCNAGGLELIEQMICKDSDMARANGELQRVYKSKLEALPASRREAFVVTGRRWITQRDLDCNVPPRGSWTEMDLRKLKSCFVEKTRARIDELQRQ
jgi:uncharacterized protein YecT (DUF1311 family)